MTSACCISGICTVLTPLFMSSLPEAVFIVLMSEGARSNGTLELSWTQAERIRRCFLELSGAREVMVMMNKLNFRWLFLYFKLYQLIRCV